MNDSTRYMGKPLLRLLECYVLKAIGELEAGDAAKLAAMEPTLARIYRRKGRWDEMIAAIMDLPDDMPEMIRDMWGRNQEIARVKRLSLPPQQFAEMFVDQNLM